MRTWRSTVDRAAGSRLARALLTLTIALPALGASCFGERFYEEGPNNAPNTIFLDGGVYETPAPDTLIQDPQVTLSFHGTDQQDGDVIRYYHYRVSPPDTGWTRIPASPQHVTLSDLSDTTYTFCVRAEDSRGGIDPDPACRRFFVDVFHLGEISLNADIVRTGELAFTWGMVGSEEPDLAFHWDTQLVEFDIKDDQQVFPLVVHDRTSHPAGTYELRIDADPQRRYCLSAWAEDNEGRQPAPKRVCYP